ncbi:hypothetical protein I6H07_07470 [Hafnia alvei]|uniref:hypothetical protein n=1 Tax=Hafnia alvei TaxID=569 RepID=UPI000B6DDBB5|nr:hypothetical protein [Hafnia alvei]MBI0275675.1 hypothetical protein [Hafnia alvei]PNK98340.1 hypothetical protein CEQ28_012505 [Hafnia alvei]
MKKTIVLIGAVLSCAFLAGCSNTGYTQVKDKDGTTVTHAHVGKGTTVTSDGTGAFTVDANKGPEQQYKVPTIPVQPTK